MKGNQARGSRAGFRGPRCKNRESLASPGLRDKGNPALLRQEEDCRAREDFLTGFIHFLPGCNMAATPPQPARAGAAGCALHPAGRGCGGGAPLLARDPGERQREERSPRWGMGMDAKREWRLRRFSAAGAAWAELLKAQQLGGLGTGGLPRRDTATRSGR